MGFLLLWLGLWLGFISIGVEDDHIIWKFLIRCFAFVVGEFAAVWGIFLFTT